MRIGMLANLIPLGTRHPVMNTLFIHTNRKQLFGARLGKYSFEKGAGAARAFNVEFIFAEELPELQEFVGTQFVSSPGDVRTYTFDDLQSFTLARFKPPELMGYRGRAVVIDPDVFALPGTNANELFELDLEGADLACVRRHGGTPESSLMVLDCARLTGWRLRAFIEELSLRKTTKQQLMRLSRGERILELHGSWNSLDSLEGAKVLHTTRRLTQPWKTGLRIDFTPSPMPKFFGIIPREPVHKLLGRYPTRYLPHPDRAVESFFFDLVRGALTDGAISEAEISAEIAAKNVRSDLFERLRD